MEKESESRNEIFPNAIRTGIINEEGNTFFVLEFGKTSTKDNSGKSGVEPLTKVVVSPDDLKVLFERILVIGLNYRRDFWSGFLYSDAEVGGGD